MYLTSELEHLKAPLCLKISRIHLVLLLVRTEGRIKMQHFSGKFFFSLHIMTGLNKHVQCDNALMFKEGNVYCDLLFLGCR